MGIVVAFRLLCRSNIDRGLGRKIERFDIFALKYHFSCKAGLAMEEAVVVAVAESGEYFSIEHFSDVSPFFRTESQEVLDLVFQDPKFERQVFVNRE